MPYVEDEFGSFKWVPDTESYTEQEIDEIITGAQELPSLLRQPRMPTSGFGRPLGSTLARPPSPTKLARQQGFKSVAEKELVEKAGETKETPDLNWWREDAEYIKYLEDLGWDVENTADWLGNKQYLEYIKYKSENPEGLASLSHEASNALGSVIKEITGIVKGIPVVSEVAKPIGSVFKLIGNLIDLPMNAVRGMFTAVASGHPEESIKNLINALEHGVTAGTSGEYFSFADAGLRVLIDNAKQGMTQEEYKEYIDSDDYRKTKRHWQLGGLLLDMVVDPMWLIGAGESKIMSSFRSVRSIRSDLKSLIQTNYKMSNLGKLKDYWQYFQKNSDDFFRQVTRDSRAMEDFGISYDTYKAYRTAKSEVRQQDLLVEMMDGAIEQFQNNIPKFDAYGSRLKFYKSLKREDVLINTPLKLEPLKRYLSRWFGGDARNSMRYAERMTDFYANNYRVYDKAYHVQLAKYDQQIKSILAGMKKFNKNATIEDAQEFWFQMMEAHKVTREGGIHSRAIGEQPGYKFVKEVEGAPFLPELQTYEQLDLPKLVGLELTDEFGQVNQIVDKSKYQKELIKPFAKLQGELYGLTKKEMSEMIREWDKVSKELLDIETTTLRKLGKFMVDEGMADFGRYFFQLVDDSRRTRRIKGIHSLEDIKSGELVHEFITYMPHQLTNDARNFLKAVDRSAGDAIHSHIEQMFYQSPRLQYLPTDFTNEAFLRKIFPEKRVNTIVSNIRKGNMAGEMQDKLWHDVMSRLRDIIKNRNEKKNLELFRDLQNTNLRGDVYNFDDLGVVKFNKGADFELQPMVQRFDAVTINRMSREGKIFKNFNKDIFTTDPNVMINRIENAHKLVGRVEASIHGLRRGLDEGWLVKKHQIVDSAKGIDEFEALELLQEGESFSSIMAKMGKRELIDIPKPIEKYLGKSEWVGGEGIFAGYWVPEMFKDYMDNFSKGIIKWTEPPDVMKLGKFFQIAPMKALKKFNQWWKVQVTMKHPAFHMRNFFSNRVVMLGEGRSPHFALPGFRDAISKDAMKVHVYNQLLENRHTLLKAGKDTKKVEKAIDVMENINVNMGSFGTVPMKVAREEFLKYGVMSNGFVQDIIGRIKYKAGLSDPVKNESFIKQILTKPEVDLPKWITDYNFLLGSKDKWTKAGTWAASMIEGGMGRNELFLHLLRKKGMTLEDAARRVNKVLVDYGAISRGEKILKDYLLPFYCVPDYTEILTKDGWKFYDEIKVGERVLTYNVEGDFNEWQKIEDIAIFGYAGELFCFGHSYYKFRCTIDHRTPVIKDNFRRIVRVYELKNNDRIPLCAPLKNNQKSILTPKEASLLGWIVTDGYFRWKGNSFESMIYQSPKKHAEKIRNLFSNYITSESIHPDSGVICFRIKSESTKNIIKYFKNKSDLPKIVTRLDKKSLLAIYEAMMDAEGHQPNISEYGRDKGNAFAQKPGPIIDAFQIICNLLGKSFQISYNAKYDRCQGYIKKSKHMYFDKKHNSKEFYSGNIWCPKTKNGTWYMRQNGKVIATGNTWQSRMIGVMGEKALTQPIFFNKLTQLQNSAYKMLELDKAFGPKYEKTGEGLPILLPGQWGKFATGKPMSEIDTKYITAERFLPQAVVNLVDINGFQDIINPVQFAKKAVEGFYEYAFGNLTPVIKTPMEQVINYSYYFKRPIQRHADQTIKYAGIRMSPKVQNVIRSFVGGMKEVDQVVGWFDKNPYSGKPYHSVETSMFAWLLGGKAYDRDEVKGVQYTLGQLKDAYRANARDANNKIHDPGEVKRHARRAVAIKYAIRILEWYKNFSLEYHDKELYDRLKAEGSLK